MSLRKKTLSGVAWTFGQQVGVQGINFIVQIILARILLPNDFGLIAIIQIFLSIGNTLMDSGMTSSLIRTENPDQRDYSTVFFINLFASMILYLILFISAPYISLFFKQELLTSIIRIYTLSFIIQALVGVQTARLTKEMNFKLQMYMQIPATLIGGVVGVGMAYKGFGVWSLVWMQLVSTSVFMLQHWIRIPWRPSFVIDKEKFKKHFNFGYKITISALITAFYHDINKVVIGRVFNTVQLGYYSQADNLRRVPVRHLTSALQKVTYPIFSSIQNDDKRLKQGLRDITLIIFFVINPIMFLLSLIAKPLFTIVLTEKWLESVPYFQVLVISSIFYPVSLYNLNIILAKGRSDLHVRAEIIKKTLSLSTLLLIIPYGLMGAAVSGGLSMIIHAVINFIYCGRLIKYPVLEQLKHLLPTLLINIVLIAILFLLNKFFLVNNFNDYVLILINTFAYLTLYVGFSYLIKLNSMIIFVKTLKPMISSIRN